MGPRNYVSIGLVILGAFMASGVLLLIPSCAYALLGACVVPVSFFGLPPNFAAGVGLVGLGVYLSVRAGRGSEA